MAAARTSVLFAVLAIVCLVAAPVAADTYAVLVAGSSGYENYRHQADICHSYQVLIKHGVPAENIITMMVDDIASNSQNPFPGKIFNRPSNASSTPPDVYKGVKIDYKGTDVNPETFLDVITGSSRASGRVLQSTNQDDVFINFVDHGGVGLIAFGSNFLYADQLMGALNTMHKKGMYRSLAFYLEACESGSMFTSLPAGINIYASTAANAQQSSWGTYCPPNDMVHGVELQTCLGDLWSVNWMQDSDQANPAVQTIAEQYKKVVQETTRSNPQQFGTMSISKDVIGDFQGNMVPRAGPGMTPEEAGIPTPAEAAGWSSRDNTLRFLYARMTSAKTEGERAAAAAAVMAETESRRQADRVFKDLAVRAFGDAKASEVLATGLGTPVADFDCYRAGNAEVVRLCGAYTDYSLQYAKVVAAVCSSQVAGGASSPAATQTTLALIRATCRGA